MAIRFDVASGRVIRVAHTAELEPETLRAARALLDEVFAEEMTEHDWDHALGGMHALAFEDGRLVGHGSVVMRRLLHQGRAWRAGYVEAVAVRADRRRRGHGAAIMEALERLIAGGYELGALGASQAGAALYAGRGWKQWRGRTWALTPAGMIRTAEEDADVYVWPVSPALDLHGDLTCDWREGDLW